LGPIVDRLGFEYSEGEGLNTVQLRTLAITVTASGGLKRYNLSLLFGSKRLTCSPSVVEKLLGWFKEYSVTKSTNHIPPNLVRSTFTTVCTFSFRYLSEIIKTKVNQAANNGGKAEWDLLRDIYLNGSDPSVRNAALSALCAVRDPGLIKATTGFMLDGARSQVKSISFSYFICV